MAVVSITDVLLELGITDATAEQAAVVSGAIKNAQAAVERVLRYEVEYGTRTIYLPQSNKSLHVHERVWETYGTQAVLRNYGTGWANELQTKHLPIRSITELRIDYDGRSGTRAGSFGVDTIKTEGTDFWANYDSEDSSGNKLCRDGILRCMGTWPETPGCVKLTAVTGYTADELNGNDSVLSARPIFESILVEAARRAKRTFIGQYSSGTGVGWIAGSFESETLGDYRYKVGTTGTAAEDGSFANTYDILAATRTALNDFINWGWSLNS